MAISVKVQAEIEDYKEKVLMGLSIRQLLCLLIVIVIVIPTYWLGSKLVGSEIASWVVIIISMPILAFGFIQKNGMTFEKYLKLMYNHKFVKKERPYRTELEVNKLIKEMKEQQLNCIYKDKKGLKEYEKNRKKIFNYERRQSEYGNRC